MPSRRRLLALTGTTLTAALAGCSSSGTDDTSTTSPPTQTQAPTQTQTETETQTSAETTQSPEAADAITDAIEQLYQASSSLNDEREDAWTTDWDNDTSFDTNQVATSLRRANDDLDTASNSATSGQQTTIDHLRTYHDALTEANAVYEALGSLYTRMSTADAYIDSESYDRAVETFSAIRSGAHADAQTAIEAAQSKLDTYPNSDVNADVGYSLAAQTLETLASTITGLGHVVDGRQRILEGREQYNDGLDDYREGRGGAFDARNYFIEARNTFQSAKDAFQAGEEDENALPDMVPYFVRKQCRATARQDAANAMYEACGAAIARNPGEADAYETEARRALARDC
ncbi:hypothetical protein [Halobacterium sp. KA-6]|uniref:hypothetical protein n=1 Tax=Halobacterium sp. KA-6 TaxID=2896368 RepID=UPI001E6178A9|nr:hypothetical protein [Halobacterium sp. KA-6]MCD2204402.1 hypothetical protein [Halobacterium sp. KA-6]